MSEDIIHSKTIHDIIQVMGAGDNSHPLITVMDTAKLAFGEEVVGKRFSSDLYCIALKSANCGIHYGRNSYDFNEGVLIFTAPEQIITVTKPQALDEVKGWMLYFHPDLIRKSPLGQKIDGYKFFNYEVHEALHLSKQEQETLNQIFNLIVGEINARIDAHSQEVLISNIELMLTHCQRFYTRQFNTRTNLNLDVVSKVEALLKNFYSDKKPGKEAQPSLHYLADKCNLSPSYLSDLLAKETGRSAIEHINEFLVDKAKNMLLHSTDSISGIAYALGFNYPHYFSRLFKQKTGKTPQEYRQLN
jgi:AraC-like DNA-binding protein